MRAQGFVEDQNLITTCRYTEGRPDRAPVNAAELMRFSPHLFLAFGAANVRAAQGVTGSIPILMRGVINPVARGIVDGLAKPGGNTTGLTDEAGTQVAGKFLQLLKDVAPRITRVAVLQHVVSALEPSIRYTPELHSTADALGLALQMYAVNGSEEFRGAFAAMTAAGADALLIFPHPLFSGGNLGQLARLSIHSRLPGITDTPEWTAFGGLLSYGSSILEVYRRLPFYAAKLLNGVKPGDLPVEQPIKYELRINLKTAKAFGLTIPPELLIQADEVIR